MDTRPIAAAAYICPMHHAVRQPAPGKCPQCGMDLMPEGTRFALVRHMLGNPLHVMAMLALMVVVMAIVMMVIRAAE
jgi:heavy metal-binding protein